MWFRDERTMVEALQPGIYRLLVVSLFGVLALRVTETSNRSVHRVLVYLLVRLKL